MSYIKIPICKLIAAFEDLKTLLKRDMVNILTKEVYLQSEKPSSYQEWLKEELDLCFKQVTYYGSITYKPILNRNKFDFTLKLSYYSLLFSKKYNSNDLIEYFNEKFEDIGYSVSSISESKDKVIITFSQIRGNKLKVLPKTLYHFSFLENKDKILREGLLPKNSNRAEYLYKNRIFVFDKYNLKKIKSMAVAISNYEAELGLRSPHVEVYIVVFGINTSKLEFNSFYKDDDIDGNTAYFTESPIPAEALFIKYEDENPLKIKSKEKTIKNYNSGFKWVKHLDDLGLRKEELSLIYVEKYFRNLNRFGWKLYFLKDKEGNTLAVAKGDTKGNLSFSGKRGKKVEENVLKYTEDFSTTIWPSLNKE